MLPADEGNATVVMDKTAYTEKLRMVKIDRTQIFMHPKQEQGPLRT